MLLPTQHPQIRVEDDGREVTATFGDRRWVFPSGDCRLLPVANTTAELLAAYIGEQLLAALASRRRKARAPAGRSRRVRRPDWRVGSRPSQRLAETREVRGTSASRHAGYAGRQSLPQPAILLKLPRLRADTSSGQTARSHDQRRIFSSLALAFARHVRHSQCRRSADDAARRGSRRADVEARPQAGRAGVDRNCPHADDRRRRAGARHQGVHRSEPVDGRPRRRAGAGQVADSKGAGHQCGGGAHQYSPIDRGHAVRLPAARR